MEKNDLLSQKLKNLLNQKKLNMNLPQRKFSNTKNKNLQAKFDKEL